MLNEYKQVLVQWYAGVEKCHVILAMETVCCASWWCRLQGFARVGQVLCQNKVEHGDYQL